MKIKRRPSNKPVLYIRPYCRLFHIMCAYCYLLNIMLRGMVTQFEQIQIFKRSLQGTISFRVEIKFSYNRKPFLSKIISFIALIKQIIYCIHVYCESLWKIFLKKRCRFIFFFWNRTNCVSLPCYIISHEHSYQYFECVDSLWDFRWSHFVYEQ